MIRSLRIALAASAVIAVATGAALPSLASASGSRVAAAVAGPRGTLTAIEYRQLTAEQVAFVKLRHDKRLTWNVVYAACHKVGQSTRLLQSIRTNCDTLIGIDQSLGGFSQDALRCSALTGTGTTTTTTPTGPSSTSAPTTSTASPTTSTTTTTTTGTTPGVLSPTNLKLFACLQPEYAVIGRAASSVYAAQRNLRGQVLARHFVGRCLLTLAPSIQQLRVLARFASSAKQLAVDVELLTKVTNGQAPASDINQTQIQQDSLTFSTDGKAFGRLHRPQKLTVCPRQ